MNESKFDCRESVSVKPNRIIRTLRSVLDRGGWKNQIIDELSLSAELVGQDQRDFFTIVVTCIPFKNGDETEVILTVCGMTWELAKRHAEAIMGKVLEL